MKTINIGLIGFGVVGSGVVRLLQQNGEEIEKRTGLRLVLKKIVDRNLEKKRPVRVDRKLLSANPDDILEDKEIDVVVELIGGYEPARAFILKALRNGKYVVTANKALLARYGEELFNEAKEHCVDIYFEASVGGGIPIILPMGLSLCANKIKSIHAILNGTCNYVLTKMSDEGLSYERALKEAQEKGFAEANPALDVDGYDSMHKLVVLASLAFGSRAGEKDVFIEGITGISQRDLEYARELGYAVKMLAIAKEDCGEVEMRVHPTMISVEHPLASVRNELNAITVNGDFVGEVTFVGKGAGSFPTASAVVADIINVAQDTLNKGAEEVHLIKLNIREKKKVKKISAIESSYYLRMVVVDKPGVLAAIAKIIAKNGISIGSVIQKESGELGNIVPLIIMTHKTTEGQMQKALQEIDKLKVVKAKTKMIRVEKEK